jgi:[phosphatase 2A protein]-leucine-carboxy methyltransferase
LKKYLESYVELDLPENTSKKAMAIRKSKELSSIVGADAKVGEV